jgi:hypothetical protein
VGVPHELLRDLGLALSSLPMRGACNNPRCRLLAGLSRVGACGGVRAHVWGLPCGSLLLQGMSGRTLEPAQASLQGCGECMCSHK